MVNGLSCMLNIYSDKVFPSTLDFDEKDVFLSQT